MPLERPSSLSYAQYFDNASIKLRPCRCCILWLSDWKAFNSQSGMIWNRLGSLYWQVYQNDSVANRNEAGDLADGSGGEAVSMSWSSWSACSRSKGLPKEAESFCIGKKHAQHSSYNSVFSVCGRVNSFVLKISIASSHCWLSFCDVGALLHLKDCNHSKSEQHWQLGGGSRWFVWSMAAASQWKHAFGPVGSSILLLQPHWLLCRWDCTSGSFPALGATIMRIGLGWKTQQIYTYDCSPH